MTFLLMLSLLDSFEKMLSCSVDFICGISFRLVPFEDGVLSLFLLRL